MRSVGTSVKLFSRTLTITTPAQASFNDRSLTSSAVVTFPKTIALCLTHRSLGRTPVVGVIRLVLVRAMSGVAGAPNQRAVPDPRHKISSEGQALEQCKDFVLADVNTKKVHVKTPRCKLFTIAVVLRRSDSVPLAAFFTLYPINRRHEELDTILVLAIWTSPAPAQSALIWGESHYRRYNKCVWSTAHPSTAPAQLWCAEFCSDLFRPRNIFDGAAAVLANASRSPALLLRSTQRRD